MTRSLCCAIVATVLVGSPTTLAQFVTWDGQIGFGWSSMDPGPPLSTNWSPEVLPGATSTAFFSADAMRNTVDLAGAAIEVSDIVFDGATPYTLMNGELTLGLSTVSMTGSGQHRIATDLVLPSAGLFAVRDGMLTIDGNITSPFALTKNRNGTLLLTGTNDVQGVRVESGTLGISSLSAIGGPSTSATLLNGTTLKLANEYHGTDARDLFVEGFVTLEVPEATSFRWNGDLLGTGRLTKKGNGHLSLQGIGQQTSTTVEAGSIGIASGASLGPPGALLVIESGALQLDSVSATLGPEREIEINGQGIELRPNGGSLTIDDALSLNGSFHISGGGTLALRGTDQIWPDERISIDGTRLVLTSDFDAWLRTGADLSNDAELHVHGGILAGSVHTENGGSVSLTGGQISGFVSVDILPGSSLSLSGGRFSDSVISYGPSGPCEHGIIEDFMIITGGEVAGMLGTGSPCAGVRMSGGLIGLGAFFAGESRFEISGGVINGDLASDGGGLDVTMSGGTILGRLRLDEQSTLRIIGSRFILGGRDITDELALGVETIRTERGLALEVILADGTRFVTDLNPDSVSGIDWIAPSTDLILVRVEGTIPCAADVTSTGATIPGTAGFGIPDGIANLDDLGYYLNLWLEGSLLADTTTTGGTLPGQVGFGSPDGIANLDDLGYFLGAWLVGCVGPTTS
ncbi:MAG: GC-type dockerin domain-anchored protein [Planctomycetota bacterium]